MGGVRAGMTIIIVDQHTLLAGDDHSTPRSVRLTHSLYPTRQSIPLVTAVCSHCSLESGDGGWSVADHSIGWYSEVRTGGCGDSTICQPSTH